jgi:hypothetical protein
LCDAHTKVSQKGGYFIEVGMLVAHVDELG